jgi:hypothetical protein
MPAAVAAATPEPKQFSPTGVYFLTSRLSVMGDDGIIGLPPGTQVTKQPDGKYLADGHVVEIPEGQLTNDLQVAARIAGADQAAQAAIRQATQPVQAAGVAPKPAANPAGNAFATRPPAQNSAYAAPTPKYVPGVQQREGNNLQLSTALGATHTRTADGIHWQKSPDGKWWVAVRRLDGKPMGIVPDRPVR